MNFLPNTLFHIYNQGSNKQQVFFKEENYFYFLWKMRAYLLPFGDLIAYCLMPNHFHWLFHVREVDIPKAVLSANVEAVENMRKGKPSGGPIVGVTRSHADNSYISLNESIGILQRTYARAINKQEDRSGNLFREKCKAKDGWIDEFVTLQHRNKQFDYRFSLNNSYAYNCLMYLHDNPTEAGLVSKPEDWAYSSAQDYAGMRKGTLVNLDIGRQIIKFV